jgi:hypothetical protein
MWKGAEKKKGDEGNRRERTPFVINGSLGLMREENSPWALVMESGFADIVTRVLILISK